VNLRIETPAEYSQILAVLRAIYSVHLQTNILPDTGLGFIADTLYFDASGILETLAKNDTDDPEIEYARDKLTEIIEILTGEYVPSNGAIDRGDVTIYPDDPTTIFVVRASRAILQYIFDPRE